MRRVAQGDRAAIHDAFRLVWPPVRALCARLLGDGPDADDAAQETMLKLFGRAVGFDPSGDALSWAIALALWECRTIRRRRQRSRGVSALTEDELRCPGKTPEETLIERETESALDEILGRLTPSERDLLLQIGRGSLPASTALRKRKQRALERVRLLWRALHGCD